MIVIEPVISLKHPLALNLIKRILTFGTIIIWLAIWAALIFSSIISRKLDAKNQAIKHQALHDGLTNLPNRTLLMDRLKQAQFYSHRKLSPFSLILIDLDNFKEINDALGHNYGDDLLIKISSRLQNIIRENDTLARLGGDEFAILLPDADYNATVNCVKRILNGLEKPLTISETVIEINFSMGITLYPEHGDTIEMLLQHADVAMYQAKQVNGTSYSFYDSAQDSNSLKRLKLITKLRQAIENDLLNVHYQPMINQVTNTITGVEALARWTDDTFGPIPPDEFIPIAEQTGYIRKLTLRIIEKTVKDAEQLKDSGHEIKIAINISTNCFQDATFPEKINNIVSNSSISTSNFELEITESTLMNNLKQARKTLDRLHDLGFRISIDDFGTGFSSLAYLKQLPVDILKIDKSFVMDMTNNKSDSKIVKTIIQLAHNLECKVVAEGIENRETYNTLSSMNNDIAQGYYISKPMSFDQLSQWLESSDWSTYNDKEYIINR